MNVVSEVQGGCVALPKAQSQCHPGLEGRFPDLRAGPPPRYPSAFCKQYPPPPAVRCHHPEPTLTLSLSRNGRDTASPTVFPGVQGPHGDPPSLQAWPPPRVLGLPRVRSGDWTLSWLTRLGVETCQSSLWEQRWLLSPRSQLLISWRGGPWSW